MGGATVATTVATVATILKKHTVVKKHIDVLWISELVAVNSTEVPINQIHLVIPEICPCNNSGGHHLDRSHLDLFL